MRNSIYESTSERLYVIIPAAGQGRRMGGTSNKQLIPVGGIPVLARTLLAFEAFRAAQQEYGPLAVHCIVVASEEAADDIRKICEDYKITFVENIVTGGVTRQDSVWNGICALSALACPPKADDIVFIHDGARCFVDQGTLRHCLYGAETYGVCTAAVPVKDTIKQTDPADKQRVASTLDRSALYAVQTPQAFQYSLLYQSYSAAQKEKRAATDDTSLAEAIGLPVYLVEGSYANIKITTPEDLPAADRLQNFHRNA